MKLFIKIPLFFIIYCFLPLFFLSGEGNQESTVAAFRVAIARKNDEKIYLIDWDSESDPDFKIQKNNQIQLYIEPITEAHTYIFAHDSENVFSILHENQWYEFYGDAEYNRFYILVSPHPIIKLERLAKEYDEAVLKKNTSIINTTKHAIIEEIRSLQNKYVQAQTEIIPPPPVTGSVKGESIEESAIGDYAILIQTDSLYSITIRFFHEK
ncbi:MAG: hypothetical protein JXJ04_25250 [Spirochaetales bacterium]|nr:hypothetical protein [Spirochaetales bacterium]